MGLFSFLSKNKQDNAEASGRFSRADDDAFAERARSKRASHAGRRGEDPVLPEKKRARRRLVGAIALALAAAVGLPMLLDSEPKPLAGDIAIQIPSKEKAPPLPVPAAPAPSVAAAESVDKGEEIVTPPPAPKPAAPAPAPSAGEAAREVAEVRPPAKPEPAKLAQAEHAKVEAPKPEQHKPDAKPKEPKPEPKPAEKPKADKAKPEDKPRAKDDSARALAILEGKPAEKAHDAAGGKVVLQVAALGSQEKAAELQAKLRDAGIHSFTQKLNRPNGELIRVKVGPYSKEEAEKVRAQLSKLGLSGTVVPA